MPKKKTVLEENREGTDSVGSADLEAAEVDQKYRFQGQAFPKLELPD